MPEDLKVSQIGSSQLPTPFRGLHSPGVRKHCQIIFACDFRKSSIGNITEGALDPYLRQVWVLVTLVYEHVLVGVTGLRACMASVESDLPCQAPGP